MNVILISFRAHIVRLISKDIFPVATFLRNATDYKIINILFQSLECSLFVNSLSLFLDLKSNRVFSNLNYNFLLIKNS